MSYLFGAHALWKFERVLLGMRKYCDEQKELAQRRQNELGMYDAAIQKAHANPTVLRKLVQKKTKLKQWMEENQTKDKFGEYCVAVRPLHTFLVLELRMNRIAADVHGKKRNAALADDASTVPPVAERKASLVVAAEGAEEEGEEAAAALASGDRVVDVEQPNVEVSKHRKSSKPKQADATAIATSAGEFELTAFQPSCVWFDCATYLLATYNGASGVPEPEWRERYMALRRAAHCIARESKVFQKELAAPTVEDVFYCGECGLPMVHSSATRLVCTVCGTREDNNDNTVALAADGEQSAPTQRNTSTKAQTAKFNFKPIPEDQAPAAKRALKRELRLRCFRPSKRPTLAQVKNAFVAAGMPEMRRYVQAFTYWLGNDRVPSMSKEQRQELDNFMQELAPMEQLLRDSNGGTCNLRPMIYRHLCLYKAMVDPLAWGEFPAHFVQPKMVPKLLMQRQKVKVLLKSINIPFVDEMTQ
jgi:uncharacterized Zn finger protein (UPF0148 family)